MATCTVGSTFIVEIEQLVANAETNTMEISDIMRSGLTVQAMQIQVIDALAGNIDVERGSDSLGWTTMLTSVQSTGAVGVFWQEMNNYALDPSQGLRVTTTSASKCIVRLFCSQFNDRAVNVTTT